MTTTAHPAVQWREAIFDPANGLAPTSRLVAAALAQYVDSKGRAYPGAITLAGVTGLSERAVRDHLDQLDDAGYLHCERQGGVPGGPRTTLWKVTTPEPAAGVTPERPAGVPDTTPEPPSTTPEPDALTPEPPAPELEELDELGGRGLVKRQPEEVDALLSTLRSTFPAWAVDQALRELHKKGTVYLYASRLAPVLRAAVEKAAASRPTHRVGSQPIKERDPGPAPDPDRNVAGVRAAREALRNRATNHTTED